jgi:hypothetical protein
VLNRRAAAGPRSGRDEAGLATLEMGLMLPWVLVLFFGAITLAQGYRVRHALRGKAVELARACALAKTPDKDSCKELAVQVLKRTEAPNWTEACEGPAGTWHLEVEAHAKGSSAQAGGEALVMWMPKPGSNVVSKRFMGHDGAMSTQVTIELTCAYSGPIPLGEVLTQAGMPEDLFTKSIEAKATMSFVRTEF